jgi:hypothetical protein
MTTPFDWAEFEAEAADPANHPKFTPVPRQRARKGGWSPERQSMFLFVLSRCGSVARAARAVGVAPRSAYRLAHAPGAEDFVRAWDEAMDQGLERLRAEALERAIGGAFVPVFRRGKLVRVEHRRCDRLALALLAGKHHRVEDEMRRDMQRRREHWTEIRAADAARDAKEEARAGAETAWAEHQAALERIQAERSAIRPAPKPRVRSL